MPIRRTLGAGGRRAEALVWSVLARGLVRMAGFRRAVRATEVLAARLPTSHGVPVSPTPWFRGAGKCLGQAVARRAHLKRRGRSSEIILGVSVDEDSAVRAHAWLDVDREPDSFVRVDMSERPSRTVLGLARLPDGGAVVVTDHERYVHLNQSALAIWERECAGGSAAGSDSSDVSATLDRLKALGLLPASARVERPLHRAS